MFNYNVPPQDSSDLVNKLNNSKASSRPHLNERHFSEDPTRTQMYGLVPMGTGVGVRPEVWRFKV